MAFRNGAWAKIWSLEQKGNYTEVRISTNHKKKGTEEYEQDFGGFVRLIGKANEKAASLSSNGRFKILDCAVTNSYNKETKQTWTSFCVFDIELSGDDQNQEAQPAKAETQAFQEATPDVLAMFNNY